MRRQENLFDVIRSGETLRWVWDFETLSGFKNSSPKQSETLAEIIRYMTLPCKALVT